MGRVFQGHIGILHGQVVIAQLIAGKKGPVGCKGAFRIMIISKKGLFHTADIQVVEVEGLSVFLLPHVERRGTPKVVTIGVKIGSMPCSIL